MKRSIHPYALVFGPVIGVVVFATLRHPLFALFAMVAAIVLIDMGMKSRIADKDDTED